MPDSSLRVRLCFFFHHHSESARRSRMTARENYVFLQNEIRYCPPFLNKGKKCSETGEKYGSDESLVEVGSVFQRY